MNSSNNMIIISIIALLIVGCGWFIMCRTNSESHKIDPQDSVSEPLLPLRNNEQMLEFILQSAKEWFGDTNVSLAKYDYGHSRTALQLITPKIGECVIVIYPCADSVEYEYVGNSLSADAASEFRLYPVRRYDYGNMIIVLYSDEKSEIVERFLESVVIDTRIGMVLALRWQEWLAWKGAEIIIADEGFQPLRYSKSLFTRASCQTLKLSIDGNKVELICCTDEDSAQRIMEAEYHILSVKVIMIGQNIYAGIRYGRFLVMMLEESENYKKIESLSQEFWSQQNLNNQTR